MKNDYESKERSSAYIKPLIIYKGFFSETV